MDLQKMARYIEEMNAMKDEELNSHTFSQISKDLRQQGQQMWWDHELDTWYIGPREENDVDED